MILDFSGPWRKDKSWSFFPFSHFLTFLWNFHKTILYKQAMKNLKRKRKWKAEEARKKKKVRFEDKQ